ncbi:MAG: hypothetical protein AAF797_08855 [Planctomycetota bacterium]
MQDRYVPDLGDFSKFIVINALATGGDGVVGASLRVGLVWYRVDLGEVNNDGSHTAYLEAHGSERQRYRACWPSGYDRLRRLWRDVQRGRVKREVSVYRRRRVMGGCEPVVYVEDRLDVSGLPGVAERRTLREAWLAKAVDRVSGCGLVVLDPDNGLSVKSVSPWSVRGVKYATPEECAALAGGEGAVGAVGGERSLVVYQHATRRGTLAEQADRGLKRLADATGQPRHSGFALVFRHGPCRLYLVVPASGHADTLRERAERMTQPSDSRSAFFSLIR